MAKTIPELFVIESLTLDDEEHERFEGDILSKMLNLSGKTKTKYYYIRTKRELVKMLQLFGRSKYRYLHISCHANDWAMSTTLDQINYRDLGTMLRPLVSGRRVFVSACEMANRRMAKEILAHTGCYSLIGPSRAIGFDDAAAFWVSFYHLMFKANKRSMAQGELRECIRDLSALYDEPINFYSASSRLKQGFRLVRHRTRR